MPTIPGDGTVKKMNDKKIVQLPLDKYVNDEEYAAYMKDFTPVVNEVIGKLIFIADKHNIDRDNAVQHFATIFKTMTEISTFQNWGGENSGEAHLECSISGDAHIECSMCGEHFTNEEVKEAAEMGEPFQFYDGKFLCPDCYDRYSRQTLEEQFETALNMGEGE